MKLAIAGKGGVGKTTLAALLAHAFAERGAPVLAIDADPSPCLGAALGFPAEDLARLRPIAELRELIAERTGTEPGATGTYFRLNPRVDDLPGRFWIERDGIRLLALGGVERGGSGCVCPESVLLKALVGHVLLRRDEVVILDMYAGVEHLGRASAAGVDAMVIAAEPTRRSLAAAAQIRELAADIGLRRLCLVGNKAAGEADRTLLAEAAHGLPLLDVLPAHEAVRACDREGRAVFPDCPALADKARALAAALIRFAAN